jgi:2',3'-cyclic-nucleotide 2'-phosphodiesterase (5'-nucleotidase family)
MDEVVGGWQIAGDGQVISQTFAPAIFGWGATNPIKMYRNGVTVTDCTGVCQQKKLWFNSFISPTSAAMGKITGLPSGYTVNSGSSPAYESPINYTYTTGASTTSITGTNNNVNVTGPINTFTGQGFSPSPSNFGDNPYSKTILSGPRNYNVDLSLYKVFPITERMALRFSADAFNALNIQGYANPNTTTGEIAYAPNGQSTSYWTPRQIQLTLRLQF